MKYCAFLRGVNVKGTNMKMVDVCDVFVKAGVEDVSSILATGNILFSSEKKPNELKQILEKSMSDYFDYQAFLFLKNKKEIEEIFNKNPFSKKDDFHIYIFVTTDGFEKNLLENFEKVQKSENEKAIVVGNTFYWQVAKGNTLDSEFGKILGKKAFKDTITSRNRNTFEKILKKM